MTRGAICSRPSFADYPAPPTSTEIPQIETSIPWNGDRRYDHGGQGPRRGWCHRRAGGGGSTPSSTRCGRSASSFLMLIAGDAPAHSAAIRGGCGAVLDDRRKFDITLEVNSERYRAITVEPRRTLADAPRDHTGLFGTHLGCEHGACGACTVLVDGDPVRACLMFAGAGGRAGRSGPSKASATGDVLHPMQECLFGISRPAVRLLHAGLHHDCRRRPRTQSRDERRAGPRDMLSSTLRRCTGYQNIFEGRQRRRPE